MTTANNAADTNTAAPAAAAAPAAPAAPSKMDKAKELFAGLRNGSIAPTEGKTARATFIATMQTEGYDMTPAGAATYWQNLVSKEKGGKLYPHTGKAGKKTEAASPEDGKPETPAEQSAEERLREEEHAEEREAGNTGGEEDDVSHLV